MRAQAWSIDMDSVLCSMADTLTRKLTYEKIKSELWYVHMEEYYKTFQINTFWRLTVIQPYINYNLRE